eukprot:scaffold40031_cov36-Phaeocystis_antarctica.AAC.1
MSVCYTGLEPQSSRPYATRGSNPRRAGRVPDRFATHTLEPRLGQAVNKRWLSLGTTYTVSRGWAP